MVEDAAKIERGVARLRWRRRAALLYVEGVVPVAIGFALLVWGLSDEATLAYHWDTWFVWTLGAVGVVLLGRHGLSRCPRCREFVYLRLPFGSNPFARGCVHCRLPLGTESEA